MAGVESVMVKRMGFSEVFVIATSIVRGPASWIISNSCTNQRCISSYVRINNI
jgi:hypothetical protein